MELSNPVFECAIDDDKGYSFEKIESYVCRVSLLIQQNSKDLGRQLRIVTAFPSRLQNMVVIYACAAMRAMYVPVDLQQPASRLQTILEDVRPDLIFTSRESIKWEESCSHLDWEDIERAPLMLSIRLNTILDIRDEDADKIMAVLFTSGSTGLPKGIALSYRSVISFVDAMIATFDLNKGDRIASLAPFHFDLSFFDLFGSLRAGATVYFVPELLKMAPYDFVNWLYQNQITHMYTVPSFLKILILKGKLERYVFDILRIVMFAGECFGLKYLRSLVQLLPQTKLYNLFGPTETNVCCYWEVDREEINQLEEVPIGKPLQFSEVCIHPENQELLVRGPQLMSGYLIKGQLIDLQRPDKWYRTGDRVVEGPKGSLLFRGRLDRMIKRNGHRIEPLEIEAHLIQNSQVEDAYVWSAMNGEITTICAAIARGDRGIGAIELRRWLKGRVPTYLEVDRFVFFERFPQLSNGKRDLIKIKNSIK